MIDAHIEKLNTALKDIRNEKYDSVYVLDEKEMEEAKVKKRKKE